MTCIRRPLSTWTTCPCDDCSADRLRLHKAHRCGLYVRADADQGHAILDTLEHRGWSARAIASASDLQHSSMSGLLAKRRSGKRVKLSDQTTRRLISHGDPTAGQVGITGTRRRLQGLARAGWTLGALAPELGIGYSTLAALRAQPTNACRATYYTRVRDWCDENGHRQGPSSQARREAEEKGWVPLMAWDDIDDPDETPQGVRDLGTTRVRDQARHDLLRDAYDWGWNAGNVADHLGITTDALSLWARRRGATEDYLRLARRGVGWEHSGRDAG